MSYPDLSIEIAGLHLRNPVIPASRLFRIWRICQVLSAESIGSCGCKGHYPQAPDG